MIFSRGRPRIPAIWFLFGIWNKNRSPAKKIISWQGYLNGQWVGWKDNPCHYKSKFLCSFTLCSGIYVSSFAFKLVNLLKKIFTFLVKVILDSDNGTEEDTGIKQIVFYGLTSFFCILTAIGLIYLCKTHCCRFQCCADLEKKDDNQVYGEYGDQEWHIPTCGQEENTEVIS